MSLFRWLRHWLAPSRPSFEDALHDAVLRLEREHSSIQRFETGTLVRTIHPHD